MKHTPLFPVLLATSALTLTALAEAQEPRDLTPILKPILEESGLPSLAAAVVIGEQVRGLGAVGVRKIGEDTPVALQDKYHLGSCTKPLTATLTAILIEEGLLTWETTIGEVLGKKIRNMHPSYQKVNVEQLLAHVAGFPTTPQTPAWLEAWQNQGTMPAHRQRLIFAKRLLASEPAYSPGTKTIYSNQGYAVAGIMLETLAKQPWEQLMKERIFQPLGMESAGFRAPHGRKPLDQPWGHTKQGPIAPDFPASDNPDAIGPAGTAHMSIGDWAKFARFHLQRKTGSLLKKASSFDRLHATLPNSGEHGIGGWVVEKDLGEFFGKQGIRMLGSNTMWAATLWILPERNIAIVVTSNSGEEKAFTYSERAVIKLVQEFAKKNH